MKIEKLFVFLFFLIFLSSCSGVKDALEGKKRSENSDEFLVEKKNPLTVPPDMNELPVPIEDEESQIVADDESVDIKKTLKIKQNKISTTKSGDGESNDLQKKILEKINN